MIWTPCPCCDEFWCTQHGRHAYECDCPPIEEWDTDPYTSPRAAPGAQRSEERDNERDGRHAGDDD